MQSEKQDLAEGVLEGCGDLSEVESDVNMMRSSDKALSKISPFGIRCSSSSRR
jgi:hypothetical protein